MLFRLLGQVRVVSPTDQPVDLGPPLQRSVLAALLLEPGYVIPVPRLVHQLWGDLPPATALKNLQGYVHRLRRALEVLPEARLRTAGGGYALDVAPHDIDLHRFRDLVESARQVPPRESHRLLDEALRLWQGPALVDISAPGLRPIGEQLDQERLVAIELAAQALIESGRHLEALANLTQLVRDHPLREDPRALLMLALYRSGRYAEALATYRDGRTVLNQELGVEPGEEIGQLHQRILRRDPRLDLEGAPADTEPIAAAGVPRPVPGFTGRRTELAELDAVAAASTGPRLAVIDGLGGAGKTALALWWAHRVGRDFPDGVLQVDLRGFDPNQSPIAPTDAVHHLLYALGSGDNVQGTDPALRMAQWQKLIAKRRCVVVLDNASSAEQVRDLLPASGPAMTLVTSRRSLTGLVATRGAHRIALSGLPPAEAHALLATLLGRARVDADPVAAATVSARCGYLPLALRVAAARLAGTPDADLSWLAGSLGAANRLDGLEVADDPAASVRAALALSDVALNPPARRVLRNLAALPGRELAMPAAAALAGETVAGVQMILAELADAQLVELRSGARLGLHDLVRAYASERSAVELGDAGRREPLARLIEHYRATVSAAGRQLGLLRLLIPDRPADPAVPVDLPDERAATEWLEIERPNLVAAVLAGVEDDPVGSWRLAVELRGFFRLRRYVDDWTTSAEEAVRAARGLADPEAEAACCHNLGHAYWSSGRYDDAADCYRQAMEASRRADWAEGMMGSLSSLGAVRHEQGRHEDAISHFEAALALPDAERFGQLALMSAGSLGLVYEVIGRIDEALAAFRTALEHADKMQSLDFAATSLGNIGSCLLSLGDLAAAEESLDRALRIYRQIGSRNGEANVLNSLARLNAQLGQPNDAAYHSALALRIARDIGDRRIEADALFAQGVAASRREDWSAAERLFEEAEAEAQRCGYERGVPLALVELASVRLRRDDPHGALGFAERAWQLATQLRHTPAQTEAAERLASAHLRLGAYDAALTWAARAQEGAESTGIPPLRERALAIRREILAATQGDPAPR